MHDSEAPLIGVCQTPVLHEQRELTPFLDEARDQARAWSASRTALFLLPELFWGGFAYDRSRELAAQTPELLHWLHQEAVSRNLMLGGTFWEAQPQGLHNTFHLLGAGLETPQRVRSKRHLFPLSQEEQHFRPGQAPLRRLECCGISCGVGICFELRFPEIFRYHSALGMDLALLSSQWPAARVAHMATLCQARAIENQCFLLCCNACGPSVLGELGGASSCITAWGEELFVCGQGPEVKSAPFSPQLLARARSVFDTRARSLDCEGAPLDHNGAS